MKNKDVKIIGICGAARSGKNLFARNVTQALVDTDNEELQDHIIAVESFAAPIKSMIAMLLDFFGYGSIMNPDTLNPYLEGEKKEDVLDKIGVSTRTLMQTLGTDWGRLTIDDDLWLNSMEERLKAYGEAKKHGHEGAFVFITDVRFDNECEMIKRNGGVIVKIVRGDAPEVEEHDSEKGVSACMVDAYIDNNEDKKEFYDRCISYLEGLLEVPVLGEESTMVHLPPEEVENEQD